MEWMPMKQVFIYLQVWFDCFILINIGHTFLFLNFVYAPVIGDPFYKQPKGNIGSKVNQNSYKHRKALYFYVSAYCEIFSLKMTVFFCKCEMNVISNASLICTHFYGKNFFEHLTTVYISFLASCLTFL